MTPIKVRGHELLIPTIKDSANRRAQQYRNKIISSLRSIGLTEDDIDVELERVAIKQAPATAVWWVEGYRLHYSYKAGPRFVENLYVVSQVIEKEVQSLLREEKTVEDFIYDFSEADEVEEERKDARKLIGVDEDCLDFDLISKLYKQQAKKLHPDMEGGDTEQFKALNRAHKILKRELT